MQHKTYKAAIFDMDGTVLNTLEDLTSALNHILAETGHDHAYGTAQVRQFFGSGVQVAITRALAIEKGIASYEQLEYVGQDGDTIAPDMVLKALKDLGLTPEQAVYIGDSEIDIQTAKNAGLDCLSVTWGFRSKTFLEKHGARFLVDTPEEIAAFF